MSKRAQAAMEFLMTYGWAILIVLIALGALYWLGVFEGSTQDVFKPDAPFSVGDMKVNTTTVVLQTGSTGVTSATLAAMSTNDLTCQAWVNHPPGVIPGDGTGTLMVDGHATSVGSSHINNLENISKTKGEIICYLGVDALAVGEKVSGTVDIVYKKTGSDIEHPDTWKFTGTVGAQ